MVAKGGCTSYYEGTELKANHNYAPSELSDDELY